jgi:hypothetical protein
MIYELAEIPEVCSSSSLQRCLFSSGGKLIPILICVCRSLLLDLLGIVNDDDDEIKFNMGNPLYYY